MARRGERRGLADDLFEITARLPWWVGVAIAAVSYIGLHAMAGKEIATATSTQDIGRVAGQGFFRALASVGQYALPLICGIGAVASFIAQRKRARLVAEVAQSRSPQALNEMDWREFESLVEESFRLRGYAVRRLGGDGPDGGVDLVLQRGSEKVLVQCKQWRAQRVGVSVVRELYGVMAARGAAAGIVVTSGSFTPDAVEFARGRNVQLIEGPALFEMIREARAARPRTAAPPVQAAPAVPAAARSWPTCGSPMVKREAKRGAQARKAFWGCSQFPACRGVVAID